jgi:hypothetical protein
MTMHKPLIATPCLDYKPCLNYHESILRLALDRSRHALRGPPKGTRAAMALEDYPFRVEELTLNGELVRWSRENFSLGLNGISISPTIKRESICHLQLGVPKSQARAPGAGRARPLGRQLSQGYPQHRP